MDEFRNKLELLQNAVPIVQAMAESKPVYNDNSGYLECQYCPATSRTFTEPPLSLEDHHEDCPIRLAAAWLEEWKKQQDKSGYYNIPVTQLKTGDIFCPPSGNPPGIITRIYRDPLIASNDYPLVTFEYEGELCGKRICDIRQDQVVRVYRGNLEDAELAWTTKYEVKDM